MQRIMRSAWMIFHEKCGSIGNAFNEIIAAGAILMLLACGIWDDAKRIEDKEEL